jgi:hypothetical protein
MSCLMKTQRLWNVFNVLHWIVGAIIISKNTGAQNLSPNIWIYLLFDVLLHALCFAGVIVLPTEREKVTSVLCFGLTPEALDCFTKPVLTSCVIVGAEGRRRDNCQWPYFLAYEGLKIWRDNQAPNRSQAQIYSYGGRAFIRFVHLGPHLVFQYDITAKRCASICVSRFVVVFSGKLSLYLVRSVLTRSIDMTRVVRSRSATLVQ